MSTKISLQKLTNCISNTANKTPTGASEEGLKSRDAKQ